MIKSSPAPAWQIDRYPGCIGVHIPLSRVEQGMILNPQGDEVIVAHSIMGDLSGDQYLVGTNLGIITGGADTLLTVFVDPSC